MKTAALIGYPLAHSVTPAMYAPAFAAMGIEAACEKWVTRPDELEARVRALREPSMFGANVTVPHKEAVLPLLDEVDAAALAIGAINCIVRQEQGTLKGYNTDKYGFLRSLREAGCQPEGKTVVLLGAGGAARAVLVGLIEAGAGSVTVANRSRERAETLVRELGAGRASAVEWGGHDFQDACARAELVVNSTPMGTAHTDMAVESPVEARCFRPGAFAFDLVYNPAVTPFLDLAAKAGARPVSGLDMLIYQGAESIRLFTGREAPVEIMRDAALKALRP
jgi:shikimate dehydrogenase